jgi:hypothetical protein
MFNIPISVKALTTAATAFVFNAAATYLHVGLSGDVKALIASGIALGIGWAVPEGAAYINKWLSDRHIPADIDVEAAKRPVA